MSPVCPGNAPLSNPQIRPSTENRAEPSILGPNEIAGQQPILKHLSLKTRPFYPAVCDGPSRTLVAAGTTFYSTEHLQEKILFNNRPCDQIRQKEGKPFPPFSVTTQQQLLLKISLIIKINCTNYTKKYEKYYNNTMVL